MCIILYYWIILPKCKKSHSLTGRNWLWSYILFSITLNLILLSPEWNPQSGKTFMLASIKKRLTVTTIGNLTCENKQTFLVFSPLIIWKYRSHGKVLFPIHNIRMFKKQGNKHRDAHNFTYIYTRYKPEKFWKDSLTEYAIFLPTEVTSFSNNTDSSADWSTGTFLPLPIASTIFSFHF